MSQQPAGWYDDPSDPEQLRYWDGVTWTTHTVPRRSPSAAQSTIGGTLPKAQTPTTPVPQGSGWHQPPQQGEQGQQGQSGHQPGQPPQVPHYPPSQYQQAPQYHQGQQAWMQAVPTTADGAPLASWGRRFGAWIIDGILIAIVSWVLIGLLIPEYTAMIDRMVTAIENNDSNAVTTIVTDNVGTIVKVGLLSYVVMTIYTIAFWTTTAQTIGKMLFRISVRRVDRPGPLDLATAVRRRLLQLASVIPLLSNVYFPFIMGADALWPLWDAKRQTLHDKIASTQVILGKPPRRHG
jgi:uncharacterized RDD family membrane protein YckC